MHQMGTEAFLGKMNRFVTKSVTRRANTKWEEHRHLQPVRQGVTDGCTKKMMDTYQEILSSYRRDKVLQFKAGQN